MTKRCFVHRIHSDHGVHDARETERARGSVPHHAAHPRRTRGERCEEVVVAVGAGGGEGSVVTGEGLAHAGLMKDPRTERGDDGGLDVEVDGGRRARRAMLGEEGRERRAAEVMEHAEIGRAHV